MNRKTDLVPVQSAGALPHVATFPRYDRSQLGCGIAHIGVGNFHRAHQAVVLDQYLQTVGQDWMIHGIGLLETDGKLFSAMNHQGNLYTVMERSGAHDTCKVIGAIKQCSHAPSDPEAVIQLLASDAIKIISLTITEKGYHYDAAGDLDQADPVIQADLAEGAVPQSAVGYLFAAASRRLA